MHEYSYWWDTVPRAGALVPAAPPQTDRSRVDVAIVGGGYTGLSAARTLARAGATVVVLERESIGWGASSRNAGQVLTGLRLDPATLVARYGEPRARVLFAASLAAIDMLESLIAEEHLACDYERTGHIQAAWKRAHFDDFRKEQQLLRRVFDHDVTLVPREAQAAEMASERYCGLLVDGRSAAINPARYVHGLAAAAVGAGASIRERTAVERIGRASSRWTLATTSGTIDAGDVLVATGGYTDGTGAPLHRRFVPVGSYVIATEPLGQQAARSLLPHNRMAFDSKHFLYYFRLTPDTRLLFGGRAQFGRPTREATRRAAAILQQGLVAIFPQLASVGVEYAWSGNVAFTRDQMPRAGRLDGLWYAGGYCGHGIAMATYLGALVARRIAGEPIDHPLFDDRFAPIPLYNGWPWFLPLVGAYYAVKDLIS